MKPWNRRCSATSKRSGVQCKKFAITGGFVCAMHGGAAAGVRAAADRRLVEQRSAEVFTRLGFPSEIGTDPTEEMLALVAEAAANVGFYRSLVQGLAPTVGPGQIDVPDPFGDPGDSSESPRMRVWAEGIAGADHLGDQAAHIWLKLYNEERDRLAKFSKLAVDAGVDERRVRIVEAQALEMFEVMVAVLQQMGIDSTEVRTALGREFKARHRARVLAAGGTIDADSVDQEEHHDG